MFGGALERSGSAASEEDHQLPPIFPSVAVPKSLIAAPIKDNMTWHEKTLFTCLQGLVNRDEPKIYLIGSGYDRDWLEYYRTRFSITYETTDSPYDLIRMFAQPLKGYVVYDSNMLDSANVATVFGSLENALPVSPDLAPRLKDAGLPEVENFVGRWTNRYDAYKWAIDNLFPKCNDRIVAGACVDIPYFPSQTCYLRDYLIAHRIFSFDLSCSLRDRKDYDMVDRIYDEVRSPGCVIGWHCARDLEHEFVALLARHGLFAVCATSTLNLSVHAALRPPERPFVQPHRNPRDVNLEKKVYVSFMTTDGDATYNMISFHVGGFKDELRGSFAYTWGFLPLAYHLMPGVAQFYYENLKDNDYLVAAPSGASYTYPHLLPRPRDFLRTTRYYMNRMGLKVVHMTNWNDEHWWQEVDVPGFEKLLRQELPDCIGYVRGMGESAFERQYIGGGPPYICCGEGIHGGSDVYATITDFVNANSIRPLFIFSLVNHTVSLKRMKEAIDRFPKEEYKLVRLDELLLLIDKAYAQGLIPADDLYPDKTELKKLLAREAQEQWTSIINNILEHSVRARLGREAFVTQLHETALSRSDTDPADVIAYDAVWDSMKLVRLALSIQGICPNNKQTAVNDFMSLFGNVERAQVVQDLWNLWLRWRKQRVSYERACALASQLGLCATALDKRLRTM